MAEKIIRTEYSEVMQKSYIDYSMSVITARALPDVRDVSREDDVICSFIDRKLKFA